MSAAQPSYNRLYIQAWTLLSIILAVVLISMFLFGDTFIAAGHSIWSLIRWLARPII